MKINKSILLYSILFYSLVIVSALLFSQQIIAWKWKTFKVINLSSVTVTKIQVLVNCGAGSKYYQRHATFKNKYAVFSQTLPYGEYQCYTAGITIWVSENNKIHRLTSRLATFVYLGKPDTFYIVNKPALLHQHIAVGYNDIVIVTFLP